MKALGATLSLLAQAIGLLSLGFMIWDLVSSADVFLEQAGGDATVVERMIKETIDSYGSYVAIGFVGAIAAWLLILKGKFRATWFLSSARLFAWLWLPLIPVGTLLGVLVLSARSAAIADHEITRRPAQQQESP